MFTVVLAMYLPTSASAYFIYGDTVKDNILLTTTDSPITYIVQTLITIHLLFGFVIVINPFCQEVESKFGVPKGMKTINEIRIDHCLTFSGKYFINIQEAGFLFSRIID